MRPANPPKNMAPKVASNILPVTYGYRFKIKIIEPPVLAISVGQMVTYGNW